MPFFDWIQDEIPVPRATRDPLQDPEVPQDKVDTSKQRGKKTKIALHRIKPLTEADRNKLEILGKSGDPSIQDLMDWGIKYEIDPSESTPSSGAGVVRESINKPPQDQSKIIRGELGDIPRALGQIAPGFDVQKGMEERAKEAKASEQFYKSKLAVEEMQKQASGQAEPEPAAPEAVAQDRKQIEDNARAVERQRAITGQDNTPGRDSIFEVFGAISPDPKREFVKQASKALQIFGKQMPVDPMAKVAFWAAMPAYAEALGQEAYARVVGPIAKIDKELRAIQQRFKDQDKQFAEQEQGSVAERQRLLEERKRVITDLANNDVLNTPLGITAFILMSLVLGPNMAAFVLTRSSTRGKLQAELSEINESLKFERGRQGRISDMRMRASMEALDSTNKYGMAAAGAEEDRARGLQSKHLDYYYDLKKMEKEYQYRKELQGGKQQSDPVAKALLESFKQQTILHGKAENEVERLRKEVDSWSQKASQAVDGNMRADFQKRWQDAEKRLKEAEARLAEAEDYLTKISTHWIKLYGSAPRTEPEERPSGE